MKKIYLLFLLLCHLFVAFGQSDLTESLIAHYPFNASAIDETGHGHDGTLFGPVPATCRFSQDSAAWDFDGVDDYIEIPNHPDLVFGDSAFSIVAWIYPEAWTGNTGLNCIISKANADEGAWLFRVVNSSQTGYVAKLNFEGVWPSQRFFANSEVTLNEWHMVALTRNGDNFTFYLDGVSDGTFTYGKSFISAFPVRISGQGDVTDERFNGRIDDIFIYGKELGAQEISDLYNLTQNACLNEPYFSYDGQNYTTVQVGYQCWMAENLATNTFSNGTPIPNVTAGSSWQNLTTAAFVWYDNNIAWKDEYGALYNWYSTVDPNGICPAGWHVPTDSEWGILTGFIGGTVTPHGNELKSCRQVNSPLWGACSTTEHPRWDQGNHWGTDDYGFSGLPGGNRDHLGGFQSLGRYESWWSSSSGSQWGAISYSLGYNDGHISVTEYHKRYGFSVRCIKSNIPPDSPDNPFPEHGSIEISIDTVFSWSCSHPLNLPMVYSFYLGTDPNPPFLATSIADTFYSPGLLNYDETYYWKVVAVDVVGDSSVSDIWSFETGLFGCGNPFIDDRDGKVYETVLVGDQCWMAQNLNYGYMIPGQINQTQNGSPEKYCYGDDPANCETYGGLYEWSEAMVYWTLPNQNCPYGWHIPIESEICTLEQTVDNTIDCYGFNWRGTDGGTKLKEGGSSGMNMLLAGGHGNDDNWYAIGETGNFWSQEIEYGVNAYFRAVDLNSTQFYRNSLYAEWALPVRCIYENDPPDPPSNPNPDIGSANLPVELELSWECSDPNNNPMTYDVWFGLENDLILIASGLDTSVCVADSLIPGSMYYWQVIAYDIHGVNTTGEIWYFSTDGYSYSEFLWVEQGGSVNNDSFEGICMDASGNSLVTGYFEGTATFDKFELTGSGQKDIVVAKLDKDGNYLWAKRAGGSEEDIGDGITCDDAGNAYITGRFRNSADFGATTLVSSGDYDVFVAKIDPSGNFIWAIQAGSITYDAGFDIQWNICGDLFLTGSFSGSADFGGINLVSSGGRDIFIARMDTEGNIKWASQAGGATNEFVWEITTDHHSNGIITGLFSGTISFGSTNLTSLNNSLDIFVAKLDSLGNHIWAISAGGNMSDEAYGISCDGIGNTYITGYVKDTVHFGGINYICKGGTDIFAAKVDPAGVFQWVTSAGASGSSCCGYGVSADADGNSYLAGYFSGTVSIANTILSSYGMQDILAAKVDKNGEFLWAVQAGGALVDRAWGISAESNGNVALAGLFRDDAIFGEFQRTSVGLDDAFVARIGNTFSCGRPIYDARDSLWYNTVQVGQQCWMAENLNTGARIDGTTDQTDNGTIEKYCYNDDPANCNTYGGLYEWEEAMAYSSGTEQICPPGWRIPSDGEICTMEQAIDTSIVCGALNWRGTDGGAKLKAGGASGMDILFAGVHRDDGVWDGLAQFGNFWARDVEFATNAWYRGVDVAYTQFFRNSLPAEYALPVRCLFDNAPPVAPYDPLPVHGSVDLYPAVELGWSCSDPDLDPLTYDIYLGTDSIPQLLVSGLTETRFTTEFLTPDTVIFWKVVARDIHGAETSSDTWEFITIPFDCGTTTFQYAGITYGTVEYKNRCWLDRNLGATQVATAWDDSDSYGYYNQWGRFLDGHQIPTSATTTTLSSTDDPGHGDFILADPIPYDWRSPQNDSLWQDNNRTNNPCPRGFYVPSEAEWTDAIYGWTSGTSAFNSALKLSANGYRSRVDGVLGQVGSDGYYQSSGVSGYNHIYLWVGSGTGMYYNGERAGGIAVRCIMEPMPPGIPFQPYPAHGSVNQPVDVDMAWSCRNLSGGYQAYETFWGFDPDPPSREWYSVDTSYNSGLFPYDTTVYWRIAAYNLDGDTTLGPVWNFSTANYSGEEYVWVTDPEVNSSIEGYGVSADIFGNIYTTGRLAGTGIFKSDTLISAGSDDIFIAKSDSLGNYLWARSAGGTGNDRGHGIATDSYGNIYICGYFNGACDFGPCQLTSYGLSDIFIAKLDTSGNFLWAKQAGGSSGDASYYIIVDNIDNVYTTGYFQGSADFGGTNLTSAGSLDIFLSKLDKDGNFLWSVRAGGSDLDFGHNISVDQYNTVYVTGSFNGTASFGSTALVSNGGSDVFVARVFQYGSFSWIAQAGSFGNEVGHGISTDLYGNTVITGYYHDGISFGDTTISTNTGKACFIASIDPLGNFTWANSAYCSNGWANGFDIVTDGQQNSYITGLFYGTLECVDTTLTALGATDCFVAKLDSDGLFEWIKQGGGKFNDQGFAITLNNNSSPFFTGTYTHEALFGSRYLDGYPNTNVFVSKIEQGPGKLPFTKKKGTTVLSLEDADAKWVDLDMDGDLDIIYSGKKYSVDSTIILENVNNHFFGVNHSLPGIRLGEIAMGDYDNDNDPDVLLCGNYKTKLYRNDGNFIFTENLQNSFLEMSYASADWSDYNNDGLVDFIIIGNDSQSVRHTIIYENKGNGVFDEHNSSETNIVDVCSGCVRWGDYNSDGYSDFYISGSIPDDEYSGFYRNNKDGSFTAQPLILDLKNGTADWGDFDNDGDLDLLRNGLLKVSQWTSNSYTKIEKNNGDGTFTTLSISLPGTDCVDVQWGDSDNDGDLDFMIGDGLIYINEGNESFIPFAGFDCGETENSCWGDYDNDGDLDILLIDEYDSGSAIFDNNMVYANSKPSVPDGLANSRSEADLVFSWDEASDNETPSSGLTYNLRIGSTSEGFDIVSPNSQTGTKAEAGYKYLVDIGNAEHDTNFVLKDASVGLYYWSVQAIDHNFEGSAFACEASIAIYNRIYPAFEQFLDPNADGDTIYVEELSVPSSRQWKISTVSGGPYNDLVGETDTIYIPNLGEFGTFYIICESEIEGYFYASNEVIVHVERFPLQQDVSLLSGLNSSHDWGDYDNDGDLDVVITTLSSSIVYRNDGNNVFDPQSSFNLQKMGYSDVKWGDYDNDGFLDLLMAGGYYYFDPYYNQYWYEFIKLYKNNGDNTFSEQTVSLPELIYCSVDWGDYDNDGDLDILLSGMVSVAGNYTTTAVYRNNGDGTFSGVTGYDEFVKLYKGSSKWGDYDNDGDLDILHTGTTNGSYSGAKTLIYRNDGHENFTLIFSQTPYGVYESSVDWGDYDQDGDLDIIVSGNYYTLIYNNVGNDIFMSNPVYEGLTGSSVAWGDYDNDGDLDALIAGMNANAENKTLVLRNDNGLFSEDAVVDLVDISYRDLSWVDYDNDGDLDIFSAGKIYKNNNLISNSVPSTPANLSANTCGSEIMLDWTKSMDAESVSEGLTYNVRLGTVPEGIDVVSPQSQIGSKNSDGWRRVVRLGNVQQDTTFRINNLDKGTYYWSVQSVDNNFAGSPFAVEQTFAIRELQLKVMLEGPFLGPEMTTTLNPDYIPSGHPYGNAPWNYDYEYLVESLPANTVDWIYIELRDASDVSSANASAVIAKKVGLLMSDGSIVSVNGSGNLKFVENITQNLYVVVWHRNHLPIISAVPLTELNGTYSYDFTTSSAQAYGGSNAQKELTAGVWGMVGGDGNADKQVNNGDKNDVWAVEAGTGGYKAGDYDMNGQVNNGDKNDIWVPNTGLGSQVPDFVPPGGTSSGTPE